MRLDFHPERSLADQIRVIENAIVVPWGQGERVGMARPAGVFTPEGTYCIDAITYRAGTRPTIVPATPPALQDIKDKISGTVLFGGLAYGHFGHALCESTARLWALDEFQGDIDSILFMPKKHFTWPNRSLGQVKSIADTLEVNQSLLAVNEPTQVDRLVIAPQGFGVNDMIAGSPEFRAFTDRRWRQRIKPCGPDKIFISRTEVFRKRGRLLLEEYIERELKAEGYEIFHPQQHDLETQLAYYKAAKTIVSTDNSALHLAAFVANEDCKVAIILRRPGKIYLDFQEHLRRFSGVEPLIINAYERFWFRENEKVQLNEIVSLVDFERVGRSLADAGFIGNAGWKRPNDTEIDRALFDYEESGGLLLTEVTDQV